MAVYAGEFQGSRERTIEGLSRRIGSKKGAGEGTAEDKVVRG